MNAKTKSLPSKSAPASDFFSSSPPLSTQERLQRIEAMGRRIERYVQFMCQVGGENAVSAESRERAVAAFYEKMVVVEGQLAQLYDQFRLE